MSDSGQSECFLTQTSNPVNAEIVPERTKVCFLDEGPSSVDGTQCGLSSFTCFHDQGATILRDLDSSHADDVNSSFPLDDCVQACCETPTCVGFEYVGEWKEAIQEYEEGPIPGDLLAPITGLCSFVLFFVVIFLSASRAYKRYRMCYLLYLAPLAVLVIFGLVLIPEFIKKQEASSEDIIVNEGARPLGVGAVAGFVLAAPLALLFFRYFPTPRMLPEPERGLVPYDRLDITATPPATGAAHIRERGHQRNGRRGKNEGIDCLYQLADVFLSTPQVVARNLLDENTKSSIPPDFTSKWCIEGTSGWIEITLRNDGGGFRPMTLDKYALRSANDNPRADPSAWRVFGIDTRTGERHLLHTQAQGNHWGNDNITDDEDYVDEERWAWKTFSCTNAEATISPPAALSEETNNAGAYQLFGKTDQPDVGMSSGYHSHAGSFGKFRIEIDSNRGSTHTQLGQVKLYEKDEYM